LIIEVTRVCFVQAVEETPSKIWRKFFCWCKCQCIGGQFRSNSGKIRPKMWPKFFCCWNSRGNGGHSGQI